MIFFYDVILTVESLTIKTLAEVNICNCLVLLYNDLKCHILIYTTSFVVEYPHLPKFMS